MSSVPMDVGSGFEGFLQALDMDMGPQCWEQVPSYGKENSERGGSVSTLLLPTGCRQVPLQTETPRPGQAAMPL